METVFQEQHKEAGRRKGTTGVLRLWWETIWEFFERRRASTWRCFVRMRDSRCGGADSRARCRHYFEEATQKLSRICSPTAFAASTPASPSTKLICEDSGALPTPGHSPPRTHPYSTPPIPPPPTSSLLPFLSR